MINIFFNALLKYNTSQKSVKELALLAIIFCLKKVKPQNESDHCVPNKCHAI